MKATGIVRKIDTLGRIVLPKELRDTFRIDVGAPLEIFVDEQSIILRKYERECTFCGSSEALQTFRDKHVCARCVAELTKTE